MSIQLKGSLKLAPTGDTLVDYSNNISSLVISRNRNSVTQPATLGTGREETKAGTLSESLTINFFSSTAAASVWAVLYDIMDDDASEVDFEGLLNNAAEGTDNPKFAGTAVLLDLETGADVGTLRQQSITLPITADGITKTTGA
jgi:hypothetical protein